MRRLALLSVLAVSALGATADATPSNPAFLGIAFGPNMQPGITANGAPIVQAGARIGTVTPDSPASRAGLMPDDLIMSIDGHPVDVNTLNPFIIAHEPGDKITLAIQRGNQYLVLTPVLTTRADMFDLLLGHPFPSTKITDSESGHGLDLGKAGGHATVVAWYHSSGAGNACIDAVPVVRDISRRVSSVKNSGAQVLAATYTTDPFEASAAVIADRKRLALPVVVTSEDEFKRFAIDECGRVFAMVIDCRGIVTFVAPVSDGDDEDAALDEIATAAAQADHKRR